MDRLQGQKQGKGLIQEGNSAVTRVPLRNLFIFCVDEKRDTADLRCHQKAPAPRREQKLAAQTASLHRTIYGQPRQPEHRHFMAGEAVPDKAGRAVKRNRRRAETVESQNLAFSITDGEKRFGPASFVAVACMVAQK